MTDEDKIKVFIASGSDLAEERRNLELLLHREGFEPIVWENIDHSITHTEFQTRINDEHLSESDVIIFMIKSKVGKYTKEEFDLTYTLVSNKKCLMYVYFLSCNISEIKNREDVLNILDLRDRIGSNGDLYQEVKDYTELENKFLKQVKHIRKKHYGSTDSIEEEKKCHNDIKKYMQALFFIDKSITNKKCCEFNICIKYSDIREILSKNNYTEDQINNSLKFLIDKKFIINNTIDIVEEYKLKEIMYISITTQGNRAIIENPKLRISD